LGMIIRKRIDHPDVKIIDCAPCRSSKLIKSLRCVGQFEDIVAQLQRYGDE